MDSSKLTTIPQQEFFAWWAEKLGFTFYNKTRFIRACDFHHNGGNMRTTAIIIYNNPTLWQTLQK